jgi:uncharacterized protein YbaR (Trm112 family)/ubiquinone/menaquinone biosynthesis C-methylase UbiE
MKLRLLDFLVCPLDKTPLELCEWESSNESLSPEATARINRLGVDPTQFSTEIITGALVNRARGIFYPIHNGVPRMLVFPTGVASQFLAEHANRIAGELNGLTLPHEAAATGEETVLRTFSSEWVNYDWNEATYWNTTAEVVYKTTKSLLELERRPVKDNVVLEVGIGIGGLADYMAREEECELVGVDLSYAVDPAHHHFGRNAFLHVVQASAFRLPFREEAFDLAYSHGVLHHTFSTKAAFDSVARMPKIGGRLYIWVYSHKDEERSFERKVLMKGERLIRPVMWRLPTALQTAALTPIVPLYLLRQNLFGDRKKPGFIRYGVREALHAARDRFTPRYAHRHSDDEVSGWFQDAGYSQLERVSEREHESFVPPAYVLGVGVQGVRTSDALDADLAKVG